jgi:hypothetical protein
MKYILSLMACVALACNEPEREHKSTAQIDSSFANLPITVREEPVKNTARFDSLVTYYIENSSDSSIILAKNEAPISWMYDRVEDTDSGKFVVVHLGRSFENHFATDGWLHIDSIKGTIYEYDVANDSLKKWSQQ